MVWLSADCDIPELGSRFGEAPFARDREKGKEIVDVLARPFMNPIHRFMLIIVPNRMRPHPIYFKIEGSHRDCLKHRRNENGD